MAALVPGILSFQSETQGEVFLALDAGVLVKTGQTVVISARRAIRGEDLSRLHEAVEQQFLTLDTQEIAIARDHGSLGERVHAPVRIVTRSPLMKPDERPPPKQPTLRPTAARSADPGRTGRRQGRPKTQVQRRRATPGRVGLAWA